MQIANLKQLFGLQKQKMAMCIITSKSNSSFGTIAKATGVKMTAKAVGKNSRFCFSVKNNLNYYTLNSLTLFSLAESVQ